MTNSHPPGMAAFEGVELRTIASGLDHPESVCWSPDEGVLYAGGEAGQVYRISLDGTVETVLTISDGYLLGIAIDAGGDLFICDIGNGCVQRVTPDGLVTRHGPRRLDVPNYPSLRLALMLLLWTLATRDRARSAACVYRPGRHGDQDGYSSARVCQRGRLLCNDSYVVESQRPGVVRLPLDGGDLEPLVTLEYCVPDGIAFDANGGLWISCFQPNRVYRLSPEGALTLVIDDWTGEYVLSPTNMAFAGKELDTLVLASLAGSSVRAITPGVRGRPIVRPVGTGR